MLRMSVDQIRELTAGELLCGNADSHATGLFIDSRECEPGCLFVALPGERTDGHDHLAGALTNGARVLIVTRGADTLTSLLTAALRRGASVIRVADALEALQEIAAWHRGRLLCPVVGITGSSGKTTTKDFLRSALATSMRVVSTQDNRNNELGVPLTLLSAGTSTDALVVEMGMRGLGQIAHLARIARPTFGLVTNVGTSHIEVVGTAEAILDAKGELVEAVPSDGAVFLNGDDANSMRLFERSVAPVTTYGRSEECDVRAADVVLDDLSRATFRLVTAQGDALVNLPVAGAHNVYNALAAAAVALRLAVPLDCVVRGIEEAGITGMRMESFTTAAGVLVMNDAYNANPSSMRAAIDTLAAVRVPGKRVAVLGDMAELGGLTELAHFQMGEEVARSGIEVLVTVGERAKRIAEGARAEGMDISVVRPCATPGEAVAVLDDILEPGDATLVKASRVMGLEAVVDGLVSPRAG